MLPATEAETAKFFVSTCGSARSHVGAQSKETLARIEAVREAVSELLPMRFSRFRLAVT